VELNGEPTYVLITQCLQNDFFLNLNCRLALPRDAASKLLIHPESTRGFRENRSRRTIDSKTLLEGPLGRFLKATVGTRLEGHGEGTLHLINIRDWHRSYDHDRERRLYGSHCGAGTWGAEYLQGLTRLLDPGDTRLRESDPSRPDTTFSPDGRRCGTVVVHHVHSDSLFDLENHASGSRSELAEVLNGIITAENRDNVRIAVIGVYTDIKVQILLQSLRVRYDPERLVVSESLTASPTLDRHLGALDFVRNVLSIDVMHGVADLARFLGSDPGADERLETSTSEIAFSKYVENYRDKQNIISYEDTQLRSYQQMTGRLRETVLLVRLTNTFLIGSGILTVGSTLVLAIFAAIDPSRLPIALPAAILGVSLVQLITIFINRPAQALTSMLSREAVFRMVLESRSLRMALMRYHLTKPTALQGDDKASAQASVLREQLRLLTESDRIDFDRIDRIGDTGTSGPDLDPGQTD
jgi:hypothetical protein